MIPTVVARTTASFRGDIIDDSFLSRMKADQEKWKDQGAIGQVVSWM